MGVCLSGVSLNGRLHTQHLGTSRMPIALRKVALPSSTHSRLCIELLPGNHLDRPQLLWLSVCVSVWPGQPQSGICHQCLPQMCVSDGLLTAINSQRVYYCQVWVVVGFCTRGRVLCISVCVCPNSALLLLGNSAPHYWVVLVIVWLHSQTGSHGIKIKEKLVNDQSSVTRLTRVTLLPSKAEINWRKLLH